MEWFTRKGVVVKGVNLVKIYRTGPLEVQALRGVTVEFYPGSLTVVMGPSGSGKTTMMNLLGGVDRPTGGMVYHGEKRIDLLSDSELDQHRLENVGFIFQTFNLIPTLTAIENVELPMIFAGIPKGERRKRAIGLLETVGIGDKAEHKPYELSGGEQQRVAIAIALANDPPIILADEPTAELDYKNAKNIIDMLEGLAREQGKTIVVTTHDPRVAMRSDRILRLEDGVLKGEYSPMDLERMSLSSPTTPTKEGGVYPIIDVVRARLTRVMEEISRLEERVRRGEIRLEEAFNIYQDLKSQKRALEDLLTSLGG